MESTTETELEARIIRDFMLLGVESKKRITAVTIALTGIESQRLDADQKIQEVIVEDEKSELEKVRDWMTSISHEKPYQKILMIEEIMDEVQTKEAIAALASARSDLINADIPLAVRVAVTKYARESPGMLVAASGGILFGMFLFFSSILKIFR